MKRKITDSIAIAVFVTLITAGPAVLFTDTESEWYQALEKPAFQPPPWVFIAVWSLVYALFASSLALALIKNASGKAIGSYLVQSVLNIGWCLVFFTLKLPFSALAIIAVYLVMTYVTARTVFPYSKIASLLFIPQGIWIAIATAINYAIVLIN